MLNTALKIDRAYSRSRIKFCISSDAPITEDEAVSLQGPDYPVMGYGFFNFQCTKLQDNSYLATWYCNATCE